MRGDGRRTNELRPVMITPGYTTYAEGSVLISMGQTRVLCTLTIEDGVPRWMQTQNKAGGWITAEYAMLPRATHQRTPRETNGPGGRTMEIRRLIGRSLRAAVDMHLLGPRTCTLDCDVIQADGGTRTAAITGAYVALAIGLGKLVHLGLVPEAVFQPVVAAVSVGVVDGMPMLDLTYAEDSQAEVDANIVMNANQDIIEFQGTAEKKPYQRDTLLAMLDLATTGIRELQQIQQKAIGEYAE